MRVSFDTNILVYTLDRRDARHAAAAALLARATRLDCVASLQSLAECFNVLVRKYGFDPRRAKQEIDGFRHAFPVCAADAESLDEAMVAVAEHGLSFWDAMLGAVAKRAGCRVLFSEDFQDGRDLDGLLFVNPFNAANRKLIDLALPRLPESSI